jgi:hypothetical protein
MEPTNKNDVEKSIINPYYATSFQDYLFEGHEIRESKEDWVARNIELIEENGVQAWLEQLLKVLASDGKPLMQELVNPYKAIIFSSKLQGEHEPTVTPEKWTQANIKLIAELGAGAWFWQLLNVLETGGPEA